MGQQRFIKMSKEFGLDADGILLLGKQYIAAGNPDKSAGPFWEKLFCENSSVIVKLNAEPGLYWLDPCVKVVEENVLASFLTERRMLITRADQTKEIVHLDFSGWPDFGIPCKDEFDLLLARVNEVHDRNDPLTVHCQAGIGRTGTFIAIHAIQDQTGPNIADVIEQMRSQRSPHMVETSRQLTFILGFC